MIRSLARKTIHSLNRNKYQTLNWMEINRRAITHNFNFIKNKNSGFSVMAVLKANAYMHGLSQVAEILNDVESPFLAVDGYFEAVRIKDITKHRILVMGYILPSNIKLLDTKKCSFVVQDTDFLKALAKLNKPVNIHMELNTGMNRLGLQPSEIDEYLKELAKHPKLHLEGIMTHLADADNPDPKFTINQAKQFDELVKKTLESGLKPRYIHIAQTAGSVKVKSKYANCIRLGLGLYGLNPLSKDDPKFKEFESLVPALEVKSTIIKTIDLKPGDRVSYNGIFEAKTPTKIGVLPMGYYEGVPRELSNKGFATHGKIPMPIRGRVCMDHTMIDITGTNLKVGDVVTVISADSSLPNSMSNLSEKFNLFTYETGTNFAESIRRIIV
jgi:alanine racemase